MLIQKAKEAVKERTAKTKLLIYGDSGSGKTWLASGASKPLIVLTEPNGFTSAAHSNPDSLIIQTNDAETLRDAVRAAYVGEIEGNKFDTLVIDSLTEIQRLFKEEILKKHRKDRFTLQMWGELADTMRKFIRTVRDVPVHVVCTALMESVVDEGDGARYISPSFEGKKTGSEIMQYFNAVGFLYKTKTEEGINRILMLEGPNRVTCKTTYPLPSEIKNPNMSDIQASVMSGSYIGETEDSE